jgi:hypothetical protein
MYVHREPLEFVLSLGDFVAVLVGTIVHQAHGRVSVEAPHQRGTPFESNRRAAKVAGTPIVHEAIAVVVDRVAPFFRAGVDVAIRGVAIPVGAGEAVAILIHVFVTDVADAVTVGVGLVHVTHLETVVADVTNAIPISVRLNRIGVLGAHVVGVGDRVTVGVGVHLAHGVGPIAVFVDAVAADVIDTRPHSTVLVVAVPVCGGDTITVTVHLVAREVPTVAILVDAVVAGLGSAGSPNRIGVVAVPFPRAETVTVTIGVLTVQVAAHTVLVDSVAADLGRVGSNARVVIVTVPVIGAVSVEIEIQDLVAHGRRSVAAVSASVYSPGFLDHASRKNQRYREDGHPAVDLIRPKGSL